MWQARRLSWGRQRNWVLIATVALACSSYVGQVSSLPADVSNWPSFPRRNIAALARDGYLRSSLNNFKRSISVLAKNGQLPTYRSPFESDDKKDSDDEESSHEKRNMASIARLRSYSAMKRNIQALARDGYRLGRNQQQNDKRNVQSLARNGMIHKKDLANEDEYYFPFYQNPIPPVSEMDGPFDANEMYDYQQSINPDMFPPLSQVFKRDTGVPQNDYQAFYDEYPNTNTIKDDYWFYKRGAQGMPVHGLLRPAYVDPNTRTKRYILSLPDVIDRNDIDVPENEDTENNDKRSVEDDESDAYDNFEKRHIGSLARLGLLPSFRFTGGRYSRSGRARLLWPSREMYRKHSSDENFGIRQYIARPQADIAADANELDVPPEAIPAYSHPTGRILRRPLNNDLPSVPAAPLPSPSLTLPAYHDAIAKNRWQTTKEVPRFYYFRSLKVPYQTSKRYLLLPAVDNIMLRKNYPNSSLPSRRKNQ